jgi:hypothetical protein
MQQRRSLQDTAVPGGAWDREQHAVVVTHAKDNEIMMRMSSSILLLLALVAWGMGLRADEVGQPNESAPEADRTCRTTFTPLIAAHLDRAIASGVDRYGPDETNLWLSSIDGVNGGLPEESTPQRRRWYRSIHSPCGSNLYWD